MCQLRTAFENKVTLSLFDDTLLIYVIIGWSNLLWPNFPQVELPHFSFNEALLKPMEDMLSLGLCDMETQDHVSVTRRILPRSPNRVFLSGIFDFF